MQKISVYIPDEIKQRISLAAKAKSQAESEVIRQALDRGLKAIHSKSSSLKALLNLAQMAEKLPFKAKSPKDLSQNHDFYAWGGEKRGKQ